MLKRIKKRHNPSEEDKLRERRLTGYVYLKSYLYNTIEEGNPNDLVNAIILYKQGSVCADCYNEELGEEPKNFWECTCEKCPQCGFRRDLCYLDIEYKGSFALYYTKKERERVREAGYELTLEILADDFYNDGRKYSVIPNNKYKDLNKLKKEFLNSVLQKDKIDLSGAILAGINLIGANLTGADLTGAWVDQADFTNAIITFTNFSDINYISGAINLKKPNPRKIIKTKNIGFLK